MGEIRWVESTKGAVALDDRTFPVLFATWTGHADETTVRAFYAWNSLQLQRVAKERIAFAIITDAISAERPDAPTRALLATLTREMQDAYPHTETHRASNIVVVESPFIRGALTAVGWLLGGMEMSYAPTCAEALQQTESAFRERGARWPVGLTAGGYQRARRTQDA